MTSTASPTNTARRRGNQNVDTKAGDRNGHITSPPPASGHSPNAAPSPSTALVSILQIWAPTLLLIFGGCCSNVYTLESLIQSSPSIGSLITAFQFLLVAAFTLPRHFSLQQGLSNLYLKERSIPLRKWIVYTLYFLSINILNNMAFKYRIGVPLHIILRSAGPVTTMLAGRIWKGRRYPPQKIVAVMLLFAGVVVAAFADAWEKQDHTTTTVSTTSETITAEGARAAALSQAPGFALLASALVLSACMGLYTDDMYATHGRSGQITAEALFYSHAMSLPYFLTRLRPLTGEFVNLISLLPPPPSTKDTKPDYLFFASHLTLPRPLLLLFLNAATQLFCVIGVNRLSAQSSSLTVSIVLNVRKLVSLVLSIWLFGNSLPLGVIVGAAVVFIGGGLYALPTSTSGPAKREKEKAK